MKIDELNISLIKHLRNGRKSFKEIADELSITENTVRSRVNRMMDEGVMEIIGLVNPESLPGHSVVFVGIKLKTMNLVQKGEEFSRLKGVVCVGVVTGRYDLMLVVALNPEFSLLEFFTREVSRIEEVLSAETFVVYHGFNIKVPYLL